MGYRSYEDLDVWREGKQLAIDVCKMWQDNSGRKFFGLQNQMERAAISIPSNIAEGSERRGAREFIQYLHIAKGSTAELRTQLHILLELALFDEDFVQKLLEETRVLLRKLQRLVSVIAAGRK